MISQGFNNEFLRHKFTVYNVAFDIYLDMMTQRNNIKNKLYTVELFNNIILQKWY